MERLRYQVLLLALEPFRILVTDLAFVVPSWVWVIA